MSIGPTLYLMLAAVLEAGAALLPARATRAVLWGAVLAVAAVCFWRWAPGFDQDQMANLLVVGLLGAPRYLADRRLGRSDLLLWGLLLALPVVVEWGIESPALQFRAALLSVLLLAPWFVVGRIEPGRPLSAGDWIRLAVWFALLTALGEITLRLLNPRATLMTPMQVLPQGAGWMIPLANLTACLAVAGAGHLGSRWIPSAGGCRRVLFFWCYLSLFSVFFVGLVRVHWAALLLLLLGGAKFLADVLAPRYDGFERWRRRSLPLLVGLNIASAIYLEWFRAPAPPQPGHASEGNRDNLLLITLDTVRPQSLELYGYPRATMPRLAEFARRGVTFDEALAPASWTLPTHASLLTGREPREHHADWQTPLDARWPTLAQRLAGHGYRTAGFVANLAYCGRQTGLARGFQTFSDHDGSLELFLRSSVLGDLVLGLFRPPVRKTAAEINRECLAWFSRVQPAAFFVWLNYYDAHDPYWIPEASFDLFSPLPAALRHRFRQKWIMPEEEIFQLPDPVERQCAQDTYDGALRYLDHHLARLLAELDRRGRLDRTWVVITNDHGEQFGERGVFSHGRSMYRQVIDAPLVVVRPGRVPAGRRVPGPASLVRLPATLLEGLGFPCETFRGPSLSVAWSDPRAALAARETPVVGQLSQAVGFPELLNGRGPVYSLVYRGWHYLRYDGLRREELFDFSGDPDETTDLAPTPAGQVELPALRARLQAELEQSP